RGVLSVESDEKGVFLIDRRALSIKSGRNVGELNDRTVLSIKFRNKGEVSIDSGLLSINFKQNKRKLINSPPPLTKSTLCKQLPQSSTIQNACRLPLLYIHVLRYIFGRHCQVQWRGYCDS